MRGILQLAKSGKIYRPNTKPSESSDSSDSFDYMDIDGDDVSTISTASCRWDSPIAVIHLFLVEIRDLVTSGQLFKL